MRIIYIDIDSMRADHLGCYGYQRPTSPVIDELAQDSVRFSNCYASDTPCLPSRAALFSGRFGINNGVTCHQGPASQMRFAGQEWRKDTSREMWMRSLQLQDWETICFSGFAQRHMGWWFTAGFTQFFGNQLPGAMELADDVNAKVLPWLQANGAADNWFMHINYWDVHHPYRSPQRYFDAIKDYPGPAYPTAEDVAHDVQHYYGPRTARDWWGSSHNWRNGKHWWGVEQMPEGPPDTYENFLGFLNGHNAGIVYVDEKIGDILETLEQLGIRDETAIIISSDHGESIGELGMYFEHGNCSEGTTHVPLIIHWPGLTDGGRVCDELIYQLDLAPTVLELLEMTPPSNWDAQSFTPAIKGNDFAGRDYLVMGTGLFSYQRAVRTRSHRLIRTIHSGLFPYDPVYLFDVETAPYQNIADEHPTITAQHDHLLMEWLWQYTTGPAAELDPFQAQLAAGFVPYKQSAREALEQRLIVLGRHDQLEDLRRRLDREPAPRFDRPLPALR